MLKKPLGLLGVFLIIVGIGYFVGAGVAYSKVQGGYGALQSFSEQQNVELSYDENGDLTDRGTVEGGQAIMSLLEDDWGFPVVDGDMDPDDPLVNSASEYMYQMATISYHTLHGTQTVVLAEKNLTSEDGVLATEYDCNGEMLPVPDPFPEEGVTCDFEVDGRYWTGFDRSVPVEAKARDQAWSGTAHALVAELGVGAATHSTLQLALGVAALLAGLGVVCTVMGVAFLLHTRSGLKSTKSTKADPPTTSDPPTLAAV
ncbi:MAG: hypothetical protein HY828_21285 [Actinobacteria bacterium]|nr:hypothetical protein [Actinomycetota bacterium]